MAVKLADVTSFDKKVPTLFFDKKHKKGPRYLIMYKSKAYAVAEKAAASLSNFNVKAAKCGFGLEKLVKRNVGRVWQDAAGYCSSDKVAVAMEPKAAFVSKFSINEKFEFLEDLVTMTLAPKSEVFSMIVTGEGGLGKTHTVRKMLRENRRVEDSDYKMISGFATPKALYRLMYENLDKTLVFDDCDSVFKDPDSANLLKAALDDKKVRRVSWLSERIDEELPNEFDFTGRVIFISNIPMDNFPSTIKSRSMMIDLTMTMADKIERMRKIVFEDDFLPDFDLEVKCEALDFLIEKADDAKDLNLRTLGKVAKIRNGATRNWKNMAEYMLEGD